MKILIINGPNLNMLGKRDDKFYGIEDFEKILEGLRDAFPDFELDYFQSNTEGAIIDRIQALEEERFQGLVINAGAYTHYSIAIRDALEILEIPAVEIHMSNVYKREPFRQISVISAVCQGVIAGFGKDSYRLGIEWFNLNQRKKVGFK